ncbi:MAG: RagB/SusD family nutrient uptake outer membrane protein [Capnocytophaga sp.]|nr:RagB/SusD family nutrient uptake outer membrane protein [Capnocytophaga sp.]
MKKIIYTIAFITCGGAFLASCSKDFTETKFFQSEQAEPLTTVEQLTSFVRGTYVKMRNADYLGKNYRGYAELHTDEMYSTLNSGYFAIESRYAVTAASAMPEDIWTQIYQVVGNANIVIGTSDNLTWGQSNDATQIANEIKRLKGQAYAIRALAFFDLLKLYGQKYTNGTLGVVLPTTYNTGAQQARATIAETETQIESDFAKALELMGTTTDVSDKTEISSWAVKALMSRYYLYKGDMTTVATLVKEIYDSGNFSVIPSGDLQLSFTKENAANSVFELALGLNGALGTNSYDNIANSAGYANLAVLPSTIALYDANDVRKNLIVDIFLDNKFSNLKGSSNIKVVRYEEVLLNGAEAVVATDNATALKYYNAIRTNRGLTAATSVTLDDIKNERIRELVGEGFRYWDLLRWGATIPYYNEEGVADTTKNKTIGDYLLAFPIPEAETDAPGSLVKANPGYSNYKP